MGDGGESTRLEFAGMGGNESERDFGSLGTLGTLHLNLQCQGGPGVLGGRDFSDRPPGHLPIFTIAAIKQKIYPIPSCPLQPTSLTYQFITITPSHRNHQRLVVKSTSLPYCPTPLP